MPHCRRGVYSGAASIEILSLKCGVYLRAVSIRGSVYLSKYGTSPSKMGLRSLKAIFRHCRCYDLDSQNVYPKFQQFFLLFEQ